MKKVFKYYIYVIVHYYYLYYIRVLHHMFSYILLVCFISLVQVQVSTVVNTTVRLPYHC